MSAVAASPIVVEAKQPAEPLRLSEISPTTRIRQKYDAAATTNENARHWANADGLGPDSALDPGVRRILRNRARYEVANDTYAAGIINTLANDTIGRGPMLQVFDLPKEEAKTVELLFWQWSVATKFALKLRTMRRAKAVDGESFASFFTNPRVKNPVRLDLQLHEAEMIASPKWKPDDTSLADGIIFDDFGNVAGYTVLREHPGEMRSIGANDYETVRADEMIHLFNADRPSQSRGAPEIAAALPLFALRRRYSLAVLRAAENAALHSGIIHTQANAADPQELEPLEAIDLERGMQTVLPKGWEYSQLKAEQPTASFDPFTKAIIREVGRCVNMPFNIAAGDSSGYNYSSGRMDHQVYFKANDVERAVVFEAGACDPTFSRWWAEARLIPGYLPPTAQSRTSPPLHSWRWDGREHVDPQKEASAQATKLSSGSTHLRTEYAKEGKDFDDEVAAMARDYGVSEAEVRRALFVKHLGGAVPAQSAATAPVAEDDEDEIPEDADE